VLYALAGRQDIVVLELREGAIAREAVSASGLLERHAVAAADLRFGMYGKQIAPGQELREGDRVEILRPLAASPNEARRRRARAARRR